jgi:hypothetical protein
MRHSVLLIPADVRQLLLAWGARGRVFESLRPDHLFFKKSSHLAVTGFFYGWSFFRGADFCPTFCPTEDLVLAPTPN